MNKKEILSGLRLQIPFHAPIYFGIFLVSGFLLSYTTLPLQAKLWIGILGVMLPFLAALWTVLEKRLKSSSSTTFSHDSFSIDVPGPSPPLWLWFLFGFFLFFTRFYQLTGIPSWPLCDEGIFSILAMGLMKKWHWNLLWTSGKNEPLLIWSMGFFFRFVKPSLFALRLYPTLLSIVTAFLAFWSIRRFSSPYFSFIFLCFITFSFWEFSLMRFCTPEDLIPIFHLLSLGLLGGFLRARSEAARWRWLLGLCVSNAFGFYSYVNWVAVWFFITLALGIYALKNGKKGKMFFGFFQLVELVLILPLLIARLQLGGLTYLRNIWIGFFSIQSYFTYIIGLFWNSKNSFPFAPNFGGMFDPVTGSLIMIGTVHAFEKIGNALLGFLSLVLFVSMLPGITTSGLELHRVTPSLPLWMLLAGFGAQCLLSRLSGKKIWFGLGGLVLVSLSLNFYNFTGPYCDITRVLSVRQWRSVQYYSAYQIINKLQKESGPLYIFSEFNPDYDNKTLDIASYPFDVLQNPSLYGETPQWAVLILNAQYAPYLGACFPGMKFEVLKTDKTSPNDPPPFGIFLIPVSQMTPTLLNRWIRSDRIHRQINLEIKNKNPLDSWRIYSERLDPLKDIAKDDRFLTAVYWEKFACFKFWGGDYAAAVDAYHQAIQQGYSFAHLYYGKGICLQAMGRSEESKRALQIARILSVHANLKTRDLKPHGYNN